MVYTGRGFFSRAVAATRPGNRRQRRSRSRSPRCVQMGDRIGAAKHKPMPGLFVTHAWGPDARGRDTHARARRLVGALRALGWRVWFDEDDIRGGSIDSAVATGIGGAAAVVVCVTAEYARKVDHGLSSTRHRDNCAKEWSCIAQSGKIVVPVAFEEQMLDTRRWSCGVLSLYMGSCLCVDASGEDWRGAARHVTDMLSAEGVYPDHVAARNRPHRRPPQLPAALPPPALPRRLPPLPALPQLLPPPRRSRPQRTPRPRTPRLLPWLPPICRLGRGSSAGWRRGRDSSQPNWGRRIYLRAS